jgi:hypothetical protein
VNSPNSEKGCTWLSRIASASRNERRRSASAGASENLRLRAIQWPLFCHLKLLVLPAGRNQNCDRLADDFLCRISEYSPGASIPTLNSKGTADLARVSRRLAEVRSPFGPKRWFAAAQQEVCNAGQPDGARTAALRKVQSRSGSPKPVLSRRSTKPRHPAKPSKIRDVDFSALPRHRGARAAPKRNAMGTATHKGYRARPAE